MCLWESTVGKWISKQNTNINIMIKNREFKWNITQNSNFTGGISRILNFLLKKKMILKATMKYIFLDMFNFSQGCEWKLNKTINQM